MATTWQQTYLRYRQYFSNLVGLYKRRRDLKMFLELILSLATISIFGAFALRPTLVTIAHLLREIKTKEELIAQMDKKIKDLNTAQGLLQQNRAAIDLLKIAIPNGPKPETYVRQIEGISLKDDVRLLGFAMGEATLKGDGAEELDISISSSGTYASLSAFLADIENLRRPLIIDNLTFNKVEKENQMVLLVVGRLPFVRQK